MRAIAVACLCSVLLSGCAASVPRAPSAPETYVVRAQDTLYSIAWRHDLDYRDLARWNSIGADYRLSIGQVLVMSGPRGVRASGGVAAAAPKPKPGPPMPPPPQSESLATPRASAQQPPPPQVARGAGPGPGPGLTKWAWPTEHLAAPRPVPGGGILLFGKLGQDVRAACAGRVVYTGNGIRGYGNLIIIKHGDNLLSSYAHNQEILVKDGQEVGIGQTIAHMGTGPHQVSVLYFEIRANGKPVDPVPYLPPR
jgi:lipoprotein NlpD